MITPEHFEAGFRMVEAAVDRHGYFTRLRDVHGLTSGPRVSVSRDGFSIELRVKAPGYRSLQSLSGSGETFEDACRHLVEGLDVWREVLRKRR